MRVPFWVVFDDAVFSGVAARNGQRDVSPVFGDKRSRSLADTVGTAVTCIISGVLKIVGERW